MADGPRRRSTRLQKMKEEEPKAAPAKRPPRAQLITTTTKKPRVPKKPAVGTLATVPEVPSAEDEAATDELLPDLLPELAVPHEWKQLLGGDEPSPQPAASTQASASASKKKATKSKRKRAKADDGSSDSDWSAQEDAHEELKAGSDDEVMSEASGSETESASDESGGDWDEVVTKQPAKKRARQANVEVTIERKENQKAAKERADREREARLEREKAAAKLVEDRHKLHFLGYASHLRYLAVCCRDVLANSTPPPPSAPAKGRGKKKTAPAPSSSSSLLDIDLSNSSDLGQDLVSYVKSFSKDNDLQKAYKDESRTILKQQTLDRLKKVLSEKKFGNMRDLAMACSVALRAAKQSHRLCVAFTCQPPSDTPKNLRLAFSEKPVFNYWIELPAKEPHTWTSFHPAPKKEHNYLKLEEVEAVSSFNYAIAIDQNLKMREVSARYASGYLGVKFRRSRTEEWWIRSILSLPSLAMPIKDLVAEDKVLRLEHRKLPLPTKLPDYKNHPLYVLERDLLKFEAIYPADTQPIGEFNSHNVYPRECCWQVNGDMYWIRHAREIKAEEKANPFKKVEARPKFWIPVDLRGPPGTLDCYGFWQTDAYKPPKVVSGKIPRNEHGNIYMYMPQMLPAGCVHLRERGTLQMAKSLDLEAVPAITGWEFSGGHNHPTVEGCVVLAKDAAVLRRGAREWRAMRQEKKKQAVQDRSLQLWRRFVKGKLILQRMRRRHNVQEGGDEEDEERENRKVEHKDKFEAPVESEFMKSDEDEESQEDDD